MIIDRRLALIAMAVLVLLIASCSKESALSGRWQYLQPPDAEGEILDLVKNNGQWRGFMNGLERAGEHGLFYYVVEVEDLIVKADGSISFTVGERAFYRKRPVLSQVGGEGDGGFARMPMFFAGQLQDGYLVLACKGDDSCPDLILRFEKAAIPRRGD